MQRVEFGKLLNLKEDYIPLGRPNRPGTPNTLEYITIHNTDNTDPSADAASYSKFLRTEGYYILKGEKIYSSWHYTVDDSRVLMHLPLNEMAYHSFNNGNTRSLAIQVCMNKGGDRKAAFLRTARLVAALLFDLRKPKDVVVPHMYWTEKKCPRLLLNNGQLGPKWTQFILSIKREFASID